MWQRFLKVVLPILLIAVSIGALASFTILDAQQQYQYNTNQEVAALLGVAATGGDPHDIIANLRQPDSDNVARGADLLRQYGYLTSDYASPSAQEFSQQVLLIVVSAIGLCALLTVIYFAWRDQHKSQQINQLIAYIQCLSKRTYDLRLEENSEDELSILSNELYKITVLLREAADHNQKSRRQLETALADISHQLRTPLTSMQVMVDNIYDDPKMPLDVRQDFLRSISRQVELMSNLITTLLNLAKFDNGSIRMQRHSVETGELLQEVYQRLEVLADLREVEIACDGDLGAKVSLDPHWQIEALTNIVKNCLEHSLSGGRVMIKVSSSALFVRFKICDTGEGIAPQDLRHIFERFYKAKNSSSDSVGIGLAFAKTVIEADNGQITVQSKEGQGTEFVVTYLK